MFYREVNQIGAISVNKAVIDEIIADAFRPYEGKVWLGNYKGSVSDMKVRLGNYNSLAETVVKMTEKGLFIRLYVMMRFGQSINEMTAGIMENLAFSLMEYMEIPIYNIEIVVTGMLSKNVAKRNIKTDYRTFLNSRPTRL